MEKCFSKTGSNLIYRVKAFHVIASNARYAQRPQAQNRGNGEHERLRSRQTNAALRILILLTIQLDKGIYSLNPYT